MIDEVKGGVCVGGGRGATLMTASSKMRLIVAVSPRLVFLGASFFSSTLVFFSFFSFTSSEDIAFKVQLPEERPRAQALTLPGVGNKRGISKTAGVHVVEERSKGTERREGKVEPPWRQQERRQGGG